MCRVIPPRPRISWCHSSFCKHRDNFMCALQHRICATEQCTTKLINARSSTTIWVTLYTAEFTQRATKSVSDTRCALCNAGYKHTLGSVNCFLCCSVWSVTQHRALDIQGVVFSTEQSACKILMMLFWWRCWNVWFSCYFTCSTYVFSLNMPGW